MSYRTRCLDRKPRVCAVCGEDSTVEVHHVDGNRANNSIQNLLAVCSDCHTSIHSGDPEYAMWRRAFGQFAQADSGPKPVPGEGVEATVYFTSETLSEVQRIAAENDDSRSSTMRKLVRAGIDSIDDLREGPSLVPRELLEEAEAELTDVRNEKQELEQKVSRLESARSNEIRKLSRLRTEKNRLTAQNDWLRERINKLEQELERIQPEHQRLKQRADLKNDLHEEFSELFE